MRDAAAFKRWRELSKARDEAGVDQNKLGPREHGAYAESYVREHPILGPAVQGVLIPGYTAAKALGVQRGRSRPSVEEMAAAYQGVGRGMAANAGDALSRLAGVPPPIARLPVTPPMSQGMSEEELRAFLLRHKDEEPPQMKREAPSFDAYP